MDVSFQTVEGTNEADGPDVPRTIPVESTQSRFQVRSALQYSS